MAEEWREITGYEGVYQVSNRGRVARVKLVGGVPKKRILKPNQSSAGALGVSLCKNGKAKTRTLHSLVAEHFIGDRPKKAVVCHLNGDFRDNNAKNLKYATQSENIAHKLAHGTATRSHLSPDDILKIKSWTGTSKSAADYFGISTRTVSSIKNSKTWKSIEAGVKSSSTPRLRVKKMKSWIPKMSNDDLRVIQEELTREIFKRASLP